MARSAGRSSCLLPAVVAKFLALSAATQSGGDAEAADRRRAQLGRLEGSQRRRAAVAIVTAVAIMTGAGVEQPDPGQGCGRTCSLTRPSPPRYPTSARALPAAGWPCHPPRLCEETEGRARRLVACRRSQCHVDHSGAPFLAPPSPFVSALRRRLALALSHAGVRARDASRRGERAAARGVRRKNASASRYSPPFLPKKAGK